MDKGLKEEEVEEEVEKGGGRKGDPRRKVKGFLR